MNDTTPERALTITRSLFSEHVAFEGFRPQSPTDSDLGDYLQEAPQLNAHFMDRDLADASAFHKQIMPYLVVVSEDKILLFRRSSEPQAYSIGVQSDVVEIETDRPFLSFVESTVRAARIQLGLTLDDNMIGGSVIGLVNTESNPTLAARLGVVMVIKVGAVMAQQIIEQASVAEAQWIPLYELESPELRPRLEPWSSFVADHLIAELSKDGKWDDKAFRERISLLAISASGLATAAVGFLTRETPRGHMLAKKMVEDAAGETQCMLAGVIANEDIHGHEVKRAAKEFHADLGDIVRHQQVTVKEILEPLPHATS